MRGGAYLYINPKGYRVTRHSVSATEKFRDCPRLYFLEKIQGWAEKTDNAARHFGMALEHAITFYHQRGMNADASIDIFVKEWETHKDKPYIYSKTDVSWTALNESGKEMVRLYTILYPEFSYVVKNPRDAFQVETTFEVFPGTPLAGIEFTSFIDLIAETKGDGNDPLFFEPEPMIVDMKTSGKDVPEIVCLDPQLRAYSWARNWRNVAFLWFRKHGRTVKKGDTVTILFPYGGHEPGECATVQQAEKGTLHLLSDRDGSQFDVPEKVVTKQEVQFKTGTVTKESAEDMGDLIKDDIIAIHRSTERGRFGMNSGVRYPKDQCTRCMMRGICAGNDELRDQLVVLKGENDLDFGADNE